MSAQGKIAWLGKVVAVQPRIRLTRSFDQRSHSYLGYMLRVWGVADGGEASEVMVGVGEGAQEKHRLRAGDLASGLGHLVADPRLETAQLYRVSRLKVVERGPEGQRHVPPPLEVSRERGHRRLAVRTYAARCTTCIWGCEMAVEMIVDHWKPSVRRYRRETFCYGPKSCPAYAAGPTRNVPGRKGMSWEEEDWVDEDATAHREADE